jgi:catechol 2,3-dioxygenase-like lactoylglutathione lyase family enzyme
MAHTSFTVSNLERSIAFYRDLLGFEVVKTIRLTDPWIAVMTGFEGADLKVAALRLGASDHVLELIEYVAPRGAPATMQPTNDVGSAHVCFAVDDIAVIHDQLSRTGVQFRSRPVAIGGVRGAGWAVYLRDPDGIPLELAQDDHAFD